MSLALFLQAAPSGGEFAAALAVVTRKPVAVEDLRGLTCRARGRAKAESLCTWQWKQNGHWRRYSITAVMDNHNWLLVDAPAPRE
ncbi:hypothetical protein P6144_10005 [Sphingomonas sp. HITSZ_GF]|uniref:hypothetical protein n=1 Tax=Sphingomonas sp. HITSZ_GF TaxID=3037247 RepID=UPI00240D2F23|nr:hypothetical protein [Sphingomonas sp. HITSZ_GF]MDG2533979.1 hypothetical protein [Sphingomonas sp. HITSZ_GF]